MKVEYDQDADAAYMCLKDEEIKKGEVDHTLSMSNTVNLDFNKEDKLIGIEILNVSKNLIKKEVVRNICN